MPGAVEPELFHALVQFGAFSHSAHPHHQEPETERRIWPIRSLLRRSCVPPSRCATHWSLTSTQRHGEPTTSGVAFFRPLYYDWPQEAAAYESKGEYVFGDQMLVAPVTAPADKVNSLATEPCGCQSEWIEWPTGKH